MTPNRRQFMGSIAIGSLASVPLLADITEAQPSASGADPLMDQIMSDLRQLSVEFQTSPGNRKGTMRAIESTLGIAAAHLTRNYDPPIRSAVARRERRIGHAAFVQEIMTMAHERKDHSFSFDALETSLTRLQQRGIGGITRDVQEMTRRLRLQAPDRIQVAATRRVQWDYCSDLVWQIQLLEGVVGIVCGIAILEPTVGGEIACGALTLALGILMLEKAFFC